MLGFSRRAMRYALLLACLAVAFSAVAPAFALPADTPCNLSLSVPAAVRAGSAFLLRGSTTTQTVPGEVVRVTVQRKSGGGWASIAAYDCGLDAAHRFSVRLPGRARGRWRTIATVAANSEHASGASSPANFKVVGSKVIALTFDDGPSTSTRQIVRALANGDANATFFVLGKRAASQPDLVKLIADSGNTVGIHGWVHTTLTHYPTATVANELVRARAAVVSATGVAPFWFRPPYGIAGVSVRRAAAQAGVRVTLWNLDSLDWQSNRTSSIVTRVTKMAHNGSVVLMHDGEKGRPATAAAVPAILNKFRAGGYDFVTLDEMAALGYRIP